MAKGADKAIELDLRAAIVGTGLLQPVAVAQSGSRIEVLCRQVPGQEKPWLKVAQGLLKAFSDEKALHLCRRYLLKDGQMVFGWHLGIEARNRRHLREMVQRLREQLSGAAPGLSTATPAAPEPREPPPTRDSVADPAFRDDMEVRRAKAASRTTAEPRATTYNPDLSLPEVEPPRMTIIQQGTSVDSRNQVVPVVIQEFPLPHVNVSDMNAPNAKGRGATKVG